MMSGASVTGNPIMQCTWRHVIPIMYQTPYYNKQQVIKSRCLDSSYHSTTIIHTVMEIDLDCVFAQSPTSHKQRIMCEPYSRANIHFKVTRAGHF